MYGTVKLVKESRKVFDGVHSGFPLHGHLRNHHPHAGWRRHPDSGGVGTQAVVQALELHVACCGMPDNVHMDSRSKLKKLEDASFDIHNVNGQEVCSLEYKIDVSPPKAHHEHGQVVRKIHTL